MSAPERVGAEAFDGHRLRRTGTWVVAFLADWCPFCRAFEPQFEELAARSGPSLLIADVSDESSPLWERFGLDVVPTVVVFRAGEPMFRADGVLGQGLDDRALAGARKAAES
jgi:thioredoxin